MFEKMTWQILLKSLPNTWLRLEPLCRSNERALQPLLKLRGQGPCITLNITDEWVHMVNDIIYVCEAHVKDASWALLGCALRAEA